MALLILRLIFCTRRLVKNAVLRSGTSPMAHVAKFYGRVRLIRSVLRASKFSVFKLTEMLILWVNYTIPFGCSLIWHFGSITFQFLTYIVWPRIAVFLILLAASSLSHHNVSSLRINGRWTGLITSILKDLSTFSTLGEVIRRGPSQITILTWQKRNAISRRVFTHRCSVTEV